MGRLTVADGKSVYFEYSPGEKATVVLIHGWGMSGRVWDQTLITLQAQGHGVLTLDHRGCGQSDKDFPAVAISDIAADVVKLVDSLGLDEVVLNGWSLGGAAAVEAAAALGARCKGLVLTCAATPRYCQGPDFPWGAAPADVEANRELLKTNRPAFMRGVATAACAMPVPPETVDWLWSIFMQTSPNADAALIELARVEQRDLLKTIACPVLIYAGGKDVFTPPEIGEAAAALLGTATLVRYDECGHSPHIENAAPYHADLLKFLSTI